MAYSSIGNMGYALIGLAVALAADAPAVKTGGLGATLFYLAAYSLGSIAAFSALTYLGDDERVIDGVDELAGVGKSHPLAAGVLAVAMFSFAGICRRSASRALSIIASAKFLSPMCPPTDIAPLRRRLMPMKATTSRSSWGVGEGEEFGMTWCFWKRRSIGASLMIALAVGTAAPSSSEGVAVSCLVGGWA